MQQISKEGGVLKDWATINSEILVILVCIKFEGLKQNLKRF